MYYYTPAPNVRRPPAPLVRYGGGRRQVPVPVLLVRRGLGGTGQSIALSAPQIAGTVVSGFAMSGATWATAAIPIVGPIIAGVTLGLQMLFARKGPRQKVATTQIVDAVEPKLQENLRGYFAGPRTQTSQYQALENFKAGWQWVVEHCGIPEMGEPGRRCIAERDRGGAAPWCPTSTGCDWWALYYDPIANDPEVRPDVIDITALPVGSFFSAPGAGGGAGAGLSDLLLPAGLIVAGLLL